MNDRAASRRAVVRTVGATLALGTAGCLGGGRSDPDDVVLAPPENDEALRDADLPYPIYGDRLPEAVVPSVLHDREVSTREFVDDRHVLLTFVYTRCTGVCLSLGHNLVQVQARAAREGYTDDIALLAIDFDPAHDTPEDIRQWGKERGFDYELGNCDLLRPRSAERAKTVVADRFGEVFEHQEGSGMPFLHTGLILLANDRGIVERAYAGDPPAPTTIIDDVESLVGV